MTPRTRRIKDIIDVSEHTQIKEVNKTKKKQFIKYLFRLKKCHLMVNKLPKKLFELTVV